MAKVLPGSLNTATEITAADILLVQKDGETQVKQISGTNFFTNYYDKTGVDSLISASAYGIKYVWADAAARDLEVGMVEFEQGLVADERKVYSYNGAAWVAFYDLDVAGTLTGSDIGFSVQAYDADIVSDATYLAYTSAEQTKLATVETNAAAPKGGTTASRPIDPVLYTNYFDTTLSVAIWCTDNTNGANIWKDTTGTSV